MKNKEDRGLIYICLGIGTIIGYQIFGFGAVAKWLYSSDWFYNYAVFMLNIGENISTLPSILPSWLELPCMIIGIALILFGILIKVYRYEKKRNSVEVLKEKYRTLVHAT